jgi:hypothetical protein
MRVLPSFAVALDLLEVVASERARRATFVAMPEIHAELFGAP